MKQIVAVGVISIAILVIGIVGHQTGNLPGIVNAGCLGLGGIGTMFCCLLLPLTTFRAVIPIDTVVYRPPQMRRLVGRDNLISRLQTYMGNHNGNWEAATEELLRQATLTHDATSCHHDQLAIGCSPPLIDDWPDALSTPTRLCKPVSVKQRLNAGETLTSDPDFQQIVTALQERYAQDLYEPFFLIVEHYFQQHRGTLDLEEEGLEICKRALVALLQEARREGNILIVRHDYRLDFDQINGLTSYQNQAEEHWILQQPLAIFDALKAGQQPGQIEDFAKVAELLHQRYLPEWATPSEGRDSVQEVISGQSSRFTELINRHFIVGDMTWAPLGSCILASILVAHNPRNGLGPDRCSRLKTYRVNIADHIRSHFADYLPFFENDAELNRYINEIQNPSTWMTSPAIQALAEILDCPIHCYIPASSTFAVDHAERPIPSTRYNEGSSNRPIYILGGLHAYPLFPKDPSREEA